HPYTLSLHDALPISALAPLLQRRWIAPSFLRDDHRHENEKDPDVKRPYLRHHRRPVAERGEVDDHAQAEAENGKQQEDDHEASRSEEHTSELQSPCK